MKKLTGPEGSPEALTRIRFIQQQNHAAYLSHRKQTLNVLDGL